MKKRPKILILLAGIFIALAISFPLQIMSLYGHGPLEIGAILNKLTYMNWIVMLALAGSAFWLYEAAPELRYAVPAVVGLVALNNFFVAYHHTDYSPWAASFASLAFGAMTLPIFRPDIRFILENPDRRWWRISARKVVQLPVTLIAGKEQRIRGETFDLSESGMFVPVLEHYADMKSVSQVNVCLQLGAFAQIRCTGRIVRHAEAKGKYPSGIGVEFMNLSEMQRSEIRRYLSRRPKELQ
jgi:hypothetical protein